MSNDDPTAPAARIWIVGNSGSGKTTLARRAASRCGVPHVELDAINHQPGWVPLDPREFRRVVATRCAGPGWVVCGNYAGPVGDLLWTIADTVVWLDLPRHTVMRQILRRTLRRVLTRQELWNGNREPWSNLWSWNPEHNVIRWAWVQHHRYRERYGAAMHDPAHAHLRFVHLVSHRDAETWLASLPKATPPRGS